MLTYKQREALLAGSRVYDDVLVEIPGQYDDTIASTDVARALRLLAFVDRLALAERAREPVRMVVRPSATVLEWIRVSIGARIRISEDEEQAFHEALEWLEQIEEGPVTDA